jgi:hypothetical protein
MAPTILLKLMRAGRTKNGVVVARLERVQFRVLYSIRAFDEHGHWLSTPTTTTTKLQRVITQLIWTRFKKRLQKLNRVN